MNDKHLIKIGYSPFTKDKPSSPAYLYGNPIGVWRVTTEGDTKDLGVWQGHVCNIAFQLAHESSYALNFKATNEVADYSIAASESIISKKKSVNISMWIESNTWGLSSENRVKWFKMFLNLDDSSNIEVKESNYYACVLLKLK
jgi:hypothetical protein